MFLKKIVTLAFAFVFVATANAIPTHIYTGTAEYSVGTGSNTSTVAIDFDEDHRFLFTYNWDFAGEDAATSWDALEAIAETTEDQSTFDSYSGSDLAVLYTGYSFGNFVEDFSYDGATKYNYTGPWNGWFFYLSDDNLNWTSSMVGVSDRDLLDGSYDSFVWSNQDSEWGPAIRTPGAMPIPEPVTIFLLGLGGLLLRRKA